MKIQIALDKGAYLPSRAHDADAGLDLYAREAQEIPAYGSAEFDTGVHIAIPRGYVGDVKSKSGLMMKYDLTTDGTIDSGYTGSVRVKLFNNCPFRRDIKRGQKIAQVVIKSIITPELEIVSQLEPTERGDNGFGSTGE
jgi:dUTP pyrophosphatase